MAFAPLPRIFLILADGRAACKAIWTSDCRTARHGQKPKFARKSLFSWFPRRFEKIFAEVGLSERSPVH
jgi:hypothetical protein